MRVNQWTIERWMLMRTSLMSASISLYVEVEKVVGKGFPLVYRNAWQTRKEFKDKPNVNNTLSTFLFWGAASKISAILRCVFDFSWGQFSEVRGVVQHLLKCPFLLSCWEFDKKINITLICATYAFGREITTKSVYRGDQPKGCQFEKRVLTLSDNELY